MTPMVWLVETWTVMIPVDSAGKASSHMRDYNTKFEFLKKCFRYKVAYSGYLN